MRTCQHFCHKPNRWLEPCDWSELWARYYRDWCKRHSNHRRYPSQWFDKCTKFWPWRLVLTRWLVCQFLALWHFWIQYSIFRILRLSDVQHDIFDGSLANHRGSRESTLIHSRFQYYPSYKNSLLRLGRWHWLLSLWRPNRRYLGCLKVVGPRDLWQGFCTLLNSNISWWTTRQRSPHWLHSNTNSRLYRLQ